MKQHNFSAGPSILSTYTIKHTAEGILDLDQSGLSIMEIAHHTLDIQTINGERVASGSMQHTNLVSILE